MSNIFHCDVCRFSAPKIVSYSERVRIGRKVISVDNLQKLVCPECGGESVPLEWMDRNTALFVAAEDSHRNLVSRGALREFRERLGLTQQEASKLLGAGPTSFAKWESGQCNISTPAALLFKSAAKFPEVCAYLAESAKVELSRPSASRSKGNSTRLGGVEIQKNEWSKSWTMNEDFYDVEIVLPAGPCLQSADHKAVARKWVRLVA